MSIDDLTKLAKNSLLLSLDRIIGPRLIKFLYVLGLAGASLLAVSHLFTTFGNSFGSGLWGIVEIGVFGLFGIISLRVACESLVVYFRSQGHEDTQSSSPIPVSLIDEVRDAIEDLAADDPVKNTPNALEAAQPVRARAAVAKPTKKSVAKIAPKTAAKTSAKPAPKRSQPK